MPSATIGEIRAAKTMIFAAIFALDQTRSASTATCACGDRMQRARKTNTRGMKRSKRYRGVRSSRNFITFRKTGGLAGIAIGQRLIASSTNFTPKDGSTSTIASK
jgi:hypothetical protein